MVDAEDEDGIEAGPIVIQEKDESKGCFGKWKWWVPVCVYIILIVAGQASGTILVKLYYLRGGNSTWLVTIAQSAGFPILIPFLFMFLFTKHNRKLERDKIITVVTRQQQRQRPSILVRGSVYLVIGAVTSSCSILYTAGMERLPASTFSLICSSTLGFNSVFSFLLNGQKFPPYVTNSVVILTFSCVLLVFDPNTNGTFDHNSKSDFIFGFVIQVSFSALCALGFSLVEFSFERIIRSRMLEEAVRLVVWNSFFATVLNLIGMFLMTRDFSELFEDENYVFMIVMMAVSWESYNVGVIGLTSKVSALFSNAVNIVSSVLVPFWCMVFLPEEFGGLKIVSLLMALWGFASYIYQQYLDDLNGL